VVTKTEHLLKCKLLVHWRKQNVSLCHDRFLEHGCFKSRLPYRLNMYLLALEFPPMKDWHVIPFDINALKLSKNEWIWMLQWTKWGPKLRKHNWAVNSDGQFYLNSCNFTYTWEHRHGHVENLTSKSLCWFHLLRAPLLSGSQIPMASSLHDDECGQPRPNVGRQPQLPKLHYYTTICDYN